ncbi:MAG: sigmaK-factor processing regulatory BofA [Clostridiaceae bacterium]|nr:sigmaK-factor processing regulatory BofA [Clostridiaceae bacterium]
MALLRLIVTTMYKIIVGGTVIFLFNIVIGSIFEFRLALNVISALFVGFLGLPGLLLFVYLKIFY